MLIHLSRPDITEKEIEAVCEVLRSPNLSLGPKLVEFEEIFARYIGKKRAVAVNSGTSGLFLCMLALGIGPGDEVITTPFTFIASATSIMMALDSTHILETTWTCISTTGGMDTPFVSMETSGRPKIPR